MPTTEIEIDLHTPNGPIVEYGAEDDAETVEAAVPAGWRVDWETTAYRLASGRYRAPLVAAAPLADALRAAIAAAKAAEQAWLDDDSADPDDLSLSETGRASIAAEAAVDAARAAFAASDEPRTYRLSDGNGDWMIESRPATLEQDVIDSVRDGDWGEDAWIVHVRATCELTDESESYTVELEAEAPACEDGHEHDWRSPYELLGGVRENPGVVGHGGGALIREVCAHCGVYQVTDTWAQDQATGEQGLHRVTYEEADEDSLAWVAARRAEASS